MNNHPIVEALNGNPTQNEDGTYKTFLISETYKAFIETPAGVIVTLIYGYYYDWWYSIIWVICGPIMNIMALAEAWDPTKLNYN